MKIDSRIHALNAEWADAGDDVSEELKIIRELRNLVDELQGYAEEIDNAALNAINNHRDIIHGYVIKMKNAIRFCGERYD